MKHLFKAIFALFVLLQISCSKDSATSVPSEADFTISLTSSHATRAINENFTLSVTKNDGTNVTSQSTFTANGQALSSAVFNSAVAGNFTIRATYLGKTSEIQVAVTTTSNPLTSIVVNPSATSVSIGLPISFVVSGNNGTNVSTTSTVIYINGVVFNGTTYTPTTAGTFSVYAVHTANGVTFTSPTIQVTVNNVLNFNKRVLIEDFTGTWCGYCPRISHAISLVKQQTTDLDIVAIHRGNDPYNFATATTLINQIPNFSGYPTGMLNRTTEWNSPEPSYVSQVINFTTGANPKLGLAFTTSVSGTTANVEVRVKFGQTFSNLKLVVYAVEDNLIYNQTNYTSYYGGASTIQNFEHDDVTRAVLTDILGDNITGNMNFNDTYTKTFTYTIPSNVNASNLKFVGLVIDSNKTSINSRTASNSVTQTFENE